MKFLYVSIYIYMCVRPGRTLPIPVPRAFGICRIAIPVLCRTGTVYRYRCFTVHKWHCVDENFFPPDDQYVILTCINKSFLLSYIYGTALFVASMDFVMGYTNVTRNTGRFGMWNKKQVHKTLLVQNMIFKGIGFIKCLVNTCYI